MAGDSARHQADFERSERVKATDKEFAAQRLAEWQGISDAFDQYGARDAGVTVEAWRLLPKHEQIRLQEDSEDLRFANDKCLTLEEYRAKKRQQFEAGAFREQFGCPQWLRDQYSKERPVELVVEALQLIADGETATGKRLLEIFRKIDARTGSGSVFSCEPLPPFAEAKARLLAEIERVGLGELFREAEAQRGGK